MAINSMAGSWCGCVRLVLAPAWHRCGADSASISGVSIGIYPLTISQPLDGKANYFNGLQATVPTRCHKNVIATMELSGNFARF